jgi:hypothetical protein
MGNLKFISAILLFGVLSCSKGESSKVKLTITPGSPMVFDYDYTIIDIGDPTDADDDVTTIIKAPWYKYGFTIVNKSDKSVTVLNLKSTVTAMDKTGKFVKAEGTIDLTGLPKSGSDTQTAIGVIPPGETLTNLTLQYWDPDLAVPAFVPFAANFLMDGLPKDIPGFSYSVQVDIMGWFGTATAPEERLEVSTYFSTQ